jgi:hypothetical protein
LILFFDVNQSWCLSAITSSAAFRFGSGLLIVGVFDLCFVEPFHHFIVRLGLESREPLVSFGINRKQADHRLEVIRGLNVAVSLSSRPFSFCSRFNEWKDFPRARVLWRMTTSAMGPSLSRSEGKSSLR